MPATQQSPHPAPLIPSPPIPHPLIPMLTIAGRHPRPQTASSRPLRAHVGQVVDARRDEASAKRLPGPMCDLPHPRHHDTGHGPYTVYSSTHQLTLVDKCHDLMEQLSDSPDMLPKSDGMLLRRVSLLESGSKKTKQASELGTQGDSYRSRSPQSDSRHTETKSVEGFLAHGWMAGVLSFFLEWESLASIIYIQALGVIRSRLVLVLHVRDRPTEQSTSHVRS